MRTRERQKDGQIQREKGREGGMEVERVRNRGRRILYSTKEEADRQTDREREMEGQRWKGW